MSRWDLTPQTWCWGDWQLLPNPDSMQLWEVSPSGTSTNMRTGSVAHNIQVQILVQYPCFQGVGPEQIEKLQEGAGTTLNKWWNYDCAQVIRNANFYSPCLSFVSTWINNTCTRTWLTAKGLPRIKFTCATLDPQCGVCKQALTSKGLPHITITGAPNARASWEKV